MPVFITQFNPDDVDRDFERLSGSGVELSVAPTEMGAIKLQLLMTPLAITSNSSAVVMKNKQDVNEKTYEQVDDKLTLGK